MAPFGEEKSSFYHDNAPAHSFTLATVKLVKLLQALLPQPSYSPALAQCDFVHPIQVGLKLGDIVQYPNR